MPNNSPIYRVIYWPNRSWFKGRYSIQQQVGRGGKGSFIWEIPWGNDNLNRYFYTLDGAKRAIERNNTAWKYEVMVEI